jgi:integrase
VAHLIKVRVLRYLGRDGKRVPKGTRGARKVREKSAKWYGTGIPGLGKKRVPLATDREAAERMLRQLVRDAERGTANVPDRKAANTPLADWLDQFKAAVEFGLAAKGGRLRRLPDARQVRLVVQRVRDALDGCDFVYPGDLSADAPERLAKHLAERRSKPRAKDEGGISAQTANFIIAAARRFSRWLATKVSSVRPDLFDALPSFDAANARTHARRDISPEDLARVFEAAKNSAAIVRRLTGSDRYHLYLTAFSTGLRAAELTSLTPASFHLDANPPAVSLSGKVTKNKKAVRLPLVPGVAISLRSYFAGKKPAEPIWPGRWHVHAAKMLRVDLAAAGVAYCVEGPDGKAYADFHALRHTFCSTLAASGAGVKELQTLARHGDSRTTLNLYTHSRSAELVRTINRLKVPGASPVSPLSELDRDQLEGLVVGMAVLLGSILGGPGTSSSRVAPPVAPELGISGDSWKPLDTNDVVGKRRA